MNSRERFETEGFYVSRSMFSPQEIEQFRNHYEGFRQDKRFCDLDIADPCSDDPLKQFPRQMQMHRDDQLSLDFLCDSRIDSVITELTGFSPLAVQTMFYFKPPTARGQALHQDNFYLKAAPTTCIAAWLAVDDCDEENGCLMVVPARTHFRQCVSQNQTRRNRSPALKWPFLREWSQCPSS